MQIENTYNCLIEHQKVLYEMLKEFDRVCKKLEIPYILFAGTMLGAVRHEGFIPWDDDVDVAMLRTDYERFLLEAEEHLDKENFFLQKEFSEHWPMFYSKLRMNNTTCLEKYYPKDTQTHQGVFIDIFPCDNAYESYILRKLQYYCSKIVIAKSLYRRGYVTTSVLKKIFMMGCRVIPLAPCLKLIKNKKSKGKYLHSFLGGSSKYKKSVYEKRIFEEKIYKRFVNDSFPISAHFDEFLKILYGDYMKIPSEKEIDYKRHTLLLDLSNSYEKYEHYRDKMQFDILTKSIR